jgi:Flp pilus assembly protein protease CpaA
VNYGLIISGVGLNILFSLIYSSWSFIINSIAGLAIFFGIAYLMFYTGQWGGGDSKMLMGLGAVIGLDVMSLRTQFLSGFMINALLAGAAYGLLWSVYLAFRDRKKFIKELRKIISAKKIIKLKYFLIALVIGLTASSFAVKDVGFKVILLTLAFVSLLTFYLWVFVKAIEKSSMYKLVEPSKLTEGDWIVKNIYFKKQRICGPKDLGIEKRQIKKLVGLYREKKIGRILIKEGIPFVPSFLIAFIITFMFGNPIIWLV